MTRRFAPVIAAGAMLTALSPLAFSTAANAEALPSYAVDMKDGVITPEMIEANAGTPFTLKVTNSGTTPAEFESKLLRKEILVAPGATKDIEINGLPSGTYEFVDEFHEDQDTAHSIIVVK